MSALNDLPQRLLRAVSDCSPLQIIDAEGLDVAQGYALQRKGVLLRQARLERVCGWKVAFASDAAQHRFGLNEPVYGVLTDAMAVKAAATIDISELIQPKLEIELVLILGRDLKPGELNDDKIVEAIGSVALGFEIADCRWADWKFSAGGFLADNAAAAMYCLSEEVPFVVEQHAQVSYQLHHNGAWLGSGVSSLNAESPLAIVCWLVRRLLADGHHLCAGQVILSGALLPPIDIQPGRYTLAMFGTELALNFVLGNGGSEGHSTICASTTI